jgi:hypothetical protein
MNIKDIRKLHDEKFANRVGIWEVAHEEALNPESNSLNKLHHLLKAKGKTIDDVIMPKSKLVQFPFRTIRLASTPRIAAAGQDLGSWLARPLVFAASGMEIDIRKILGSEDKVNVYVHPTGNDFSEIEKTLMPFKEKTLQVRLSIDGKELLKANIYVDETGHNAEGTGHLKSIDESEVHGNIDLDIIVEE